MAITYATIKIYKGTIQGETPTETTSEYNQYYLDSGEDYTIVADQPATGMVFKKWETDGLIDDSASSTTTYSPGVEALESYARAVYGHAEKAYLDLDGLDVLASKVQKKVTYGTEDLTPRS